MANSNPKTMSVNTSFTGGLKTPSPEQPQYHKHNRQDSVQTGAFNQHQTPQHAYNQYPVYPPMWHNSAITSAGDQQPLTSASSPEHSVYYNRKPESLNQASSHMRQASQSQMPQQPAQGQWANAYAYHQSGLYTPVSESNEKTAKRRRSPEQDDQATYVKRQRQDSIQSNVMHSRQTSQAQYTSHPMSAGVPTTAGAQHGMPAARPQMPFAGQYVNESATPVAVSAADAVPRFYTGYAPTQSMSNGMQNYGQGVPMSTAYGYTPYVSTMPSETGSAGQARVEETINAHDENTGTVLDETGQTQPPGHKIKVSATLWEDEHTLCYQVEARGISVARREDNGMINGTKLLNVSGMTRGRRDGILKAEKNRRVVKIGPMHLKGVWIPYDRALAFANKEKITDQLYPLFSHQIQCSLFPNSATSRVVSTHAAPL